MVNVFSESGELPDDRAGCPLNKHATLSHAREGRVRGWCGVLCVTPVQWTNDQYLAAWFKRCACTGMLLKPIFCFTQFRRKSMQVNKEKQIRTEELSLNRRTLARWALGGSATLALVACGGGGGGDDNSSQNGRTLRPAHDALQPGMGRQEVIDVVGSAPDTDVPDTMTWRRYGELLRVSFAYRSRTDDFVIISSSWLAAVPSAEDNFRQLI